MADNAVNRLGQINNTGLTDALFLKVYAETLNAFNRTTKAKDRHYLRSIQSGKSAQFPTIGRAAARYHTAGTEITGQAIPHGEKTLTVDGLLISDVTIAEIDEAMSHFEVRSEYTRLLGEELAMEFDRNVFRVGIQAARTTGWHSSMPGGTKLVVSTARTSGLDLSAAIYTAGVTFDENWVPETERYAYVRPLQYALLVQETKNINKDWGGQGSYADGTIQKINDIELVKTNNLPTTNVTGTIGNKYDVNASSTAALVLHRNAVGTVKLIDMKIGAEWSERRQSTLMVAKQAMGHGVLRPEAAVEIAIA